MPRTKLYNENEVLEKAMDLFWQKGYHATSVQDLVSHLGIHRGSLYSEFGDKKQLFSKSLAHYRKINTQNLRKFLDAQPSVKQGFRNLLEIAIQENLEDECKKGCFMVNATTELAASDPEIKKLLKGNHLTITSLFTDFIEKGKSNGEIEPERDSRSIANLIFTFYSGIKVIGKIHNDKSTLMKAVDTALNVL